MTSTQQKAKAETQWLQCQIPPDEWNKINERRLKFKLRWVDVLLPATSAYLDKLEAEQPSAEEEVKAEAPTAKNKGKKAPAKKSQQGVKNEA